MRGCAGVVSDGGFRDAEGIGKLDMPAYHQRPSAPTNLTLHEALDINVPISCGDAPVFPGDVLVGDGDGVMVIPTHLADEIADECTGTGNRPQHRLRLRLASEQDEIELDVVARPCLPRIDEAERPPVAAETPARIRADRFDDRGSPETIERLAPSGGQCDQPGLIARRQLEPRRTVALSMASELETEKVDQRQQCDLGDGAHA